MRVELEVLKGKKRSLFPSNIAGRMLGMLGQAKCPAEECVTIHCEHTIIRRLRCVATSKIYY